MKFCLLALCLGLLGRPIFAEKRQALTHSTKAEVIAALVKKLDSNYVLPELAKKMERAILAKQAGNGYAAIGTGPEFAKALTDDLISVSKDHHLGIEFSSGGISYDSEKPVDPEVVRKFREMGRQANFEFAKVERLSGSVGLLELDGFYPGEWTADTLAASMAFLGNSDAVILDLRNNHGGFGDGAALICSYFFAESTHIADEYNRTTDTSSQIWTYPVGPHESMAGRDLYILTSHETFSAPEWLAYMMQALKRATIVGETTGGGAHGTTMFRLTDQFAASIPCNRQTSPITKSDWEGIGVKPDVPVPADEALLTAHVLALKKLLSRTVNDPDLADRLRRIIVEKEKELAALRATYPEK